MPDPTSGPDFGASPGGREERQNGVLAVLTVLAVITVIAVSVIRGHGLLGSRNRLLLGGIGLLGVVEALCVEPAATEFRVSGLQSPRLKVPCIPCELHLHLLRAIVRLHYFPRVLLEPLPPVAPDVHLRWELVVQDKGLGRLSSVEREAVVPQGDLSLGALLPRNDPVFLKFPPRDFEFLERGPRSRAHFLPLG